MLDINVNALKAKSLVTSEQIDIPVVGNTKYVEINPNTATTASVKTVIDAGKIPFFIDNGLYGIYWGKKNGAHVFCAGLSNNTRIVKFYVTGDTTGLRTLGTEQFFNPEWVCTDEEITAETDRDLFPTVGLTKDYVDNNVSTINNALSSLEETVVTGKYMDSFNLEMGWITKSGIDQDNTATYRGVRTVNYIKLSDVEDLIIGEHLGNSTIFSYDENKNFLRRKGYSTGSSLKDGTIALGDDVIYIRLVLLYDSSVIGEPTFEKFRECWSLEYKTSFSTLDDRLTSVENAISKEWTAIGTISTDNKDTELTVDLTGYSELYIAGSSLATGVTSLTVNGKSLTTTSSTSTTGMTTNGSRFVVMMFADDGTGAMYPVIYKHGTDYTSGLNSNLSSYWLPLKISDITKIAFKDSSLITTCTFSILAR